MTRIINYTTAFFVFCLGVGSFVLSYAALWDMATAYGVPQELAWIWPLLIDFALIVFSMSVVQSNLNNEPATRRWLMVALYTIATVAFNVYHAPNNYAAQVVAVVAPVSLFLSFETLMSMLKSGVRRKAIVQSIEQITAKLGELEGLYRDRKDKLESELERLRQTRQQELETIQAQIAQAQIKLSDILGQIEAQKDGQKDKQVPVVIIGEGLDLPKMKPAERQKYLPQLLNGGR